MWEGETKRMGREEVEKKEKRGKNGTESMVVTIPKVVATRSFLS